MTIPKFGRLTLSQGLILGLIGYELSRAEALLPTNTVIRLKNISQARDYLHNLSGKRQIPANRYRTNHNPDELVNSFFQ